jgi:hypothetical protein
VFDFSSSDQFVFDPAPVASGLLDSSAMGAVHVDIGVNFEGGFSQVDSSSDDGWFVYHNNTGVLEWSAGGDAGGGDGVLATTSMQFMFSGGDGVTVDA